jgi:uncharacterized surface protein with fasciclin (FAS1) repeats
MLHVTVATFRAEKSRRTRRQLERNFMRLDRLVITAAALSLTAAAAWAETAPATPATEAAPAAPATSATPAAPATSGKLAPNGDIIQTIKLSGQFNTFVKAADATNLTALLKNNKNLTVFAPTDAAFAALPPGELDKLMADKAQLQKLLTYHIINAPVDSTKIKGAKGAVPTVAATPVEIDGSEEPLKVNDAHIVQADVRASNGVIHVIDKVLTPGAAVGASAPASATAPAAAPAPGQ